VKTINRAAYWRALRDRALRWPQGLADWIEAGVPTVLVIVLTWIALGQDRASEEIATTLVTLSAVAASLLIGGALRLSRAALDVHQEDLGNISRIERECDERMSAAAVEADRLRAQIVVLEKKLDDVEPNLQVLTVPRESSGGAGFEGRVFADSFYITCEIAVINTGTRPMTIIAATARASTARGDDIEGFIEKLHQPEPDATIGVRITKDLPMRLEGGDARWIPIKFTVLAPGMKHFVAGWYSGVLDLQFTTTAGTIERKSEFHVNGRRLDYQLRRIPGT